MYGITVKRYCSNCDEIQTDRYPTTYAVDGEICVDFFECPKCGKDLAEEDKNIMEKAKKEGKSIGTVMS